MYILHGLSFSICFSPCALLVISHHQIYLTSRTFRQLTVFQQFNQYKDELRKPLKLNSGFNDFICLNCHSNHHCAICRPVKASTDIAIRSMLQNTIIILAIVSIVLFIFSIPLPTEPTVCRASGLGGGFELFDTFG